MLLGYGACAKVQKRGTVKGNPGGGGGGGERGKIGPSCRVG